MTAPERIWLLDPINAEEFGRPVTSLEQPDWRDAEDPPVIFSTYILATPSALAASPEFQALVKAAVEAERERLAAMVDDYPEWADNWGEHRNQVAADAAAKEIATAIRAEVPK